MTMRLVLVHRTDLALFYVTCPHCGKGFGKTKRPELVFESADQRTAIHKACVERLLAMPDPAEVAERHNQAHEALLADQAALRSERATR